MKLYRALDVSFLCIIWGLLLLFRCVSGHPNFLSCNTPLTAGVTRIHSQLLSTGSTVTISISRGSQALQPNAYYIPGETLRVTIFASGQEFILQATNALFAGGSCSGRRSLASTGNLIMPNDGSTVSIVAATAPFKTTVRLTNSFNLIASPNPTAAPINPTFSPSTAPTVAPSFSPTLSPTSAPLPTFSPTSAPLPTFDPTSASLPTLNITVPLPTLSPITAPLPTHSPISSPTLSPISSPTLSPISAPPPTHAPSASPFSPTVAPISSAKPTTAPSYAPTFKYPNNAISIPQGFRAAIFFNLTSQPQGPNVDLSLQAIAYTLSLNASCDPNRVIVNNIGDISPQNVDSSTNSKGFSISHILEDLFKVGRHQFDQDKSKQFTFLSIITTSYAAQIVGFDSKANASAAALLTSAYINTGTFAPDVSAISGIPILKASVISTNVSI